MPQLPAKFYLLHSDLQWRGFVCFIVIFMKHELSQLFNSVELIKTKKSSCASNFTKSVWILIVSLVALLIALAQCHL